ncbi:hypothetical protein BDN71DRAFT_1428914 [Pleurotus eryngii]|uniref:Uncharacterized protein n=1 Tax=Pleurotus eryngii TaxID=5323 RepID=A0A9P6DHR1_PLEER|nr:hypothetical protein BDN71DRAFT_1428914 [Pleurotus eryngii]
MCMKKLLLRLPGKQRREFSKKAVSFDTLHTFDNGLFEDHLYVQLVEHIKALGCAAVVKLDTQISAIPPCTLSFNDGSKNCDISKIILFASYNILTKEADEVGYLLLCCLRAYMDMQMYAGMQLHTEETISAGREAVARFSELLEVLHETTTQNPMSKCMAHSEKSISVQISEILLHRFFRRFTESWWQNIFGKTLMIMMLQLQVLYKMLK